ncbi:MAG: N-acetylmuramoyl-L-alanine amidase [Solirubrobacterales bacterium]
MSRISKRVLDSGRGATTKQDTSRIRAARTAQVPFIAAVFLALATAAGTEPIAARSGDEPSLTIDRSGKRGYEAKVRLEAETEVRVRIETRIVGRAVDGKRRTIDSDTAEEDGGPGRVRFTAPFEGVHDACFGYVRCKLVATATSSPLTAPVPPATEPTAGEPNEVGREQRKAPTGMPAIRERPITYGSARRKQMAAYSERHYGKRDWKLEPRGIVEHYTASSTAGPALATFEANRPDVEFGELPGVCAHYLIDTDGTIFELVDTGTRCRHTVGLNHETIGIEHVGNSDGDVVGRPRVLRASLELTSWLRCAYAIERSNVIGHSESLGSPLYKELDPDFQGQTHGDMRASTMKGYRRKIADC